MACTDQGSFASKQVATVVAAGLHNHRSCPVSFASCAAITLYSFATMDSALLTTVEQLSDDPPHSRNELNGMWPSGSTLAPAVQSAPAYSSKSLLPGVRDGQNGAMEPLDR